MTLFDFLKQVEGCRLDVYKDSAGKPTVGVGHLIVPADNLKMGDTITMERAAQLLEQDASAASAAVAHLVKVPLNDNQRVALTSFVFNVGIGAFSKSTLLKYVNTGQFPEAAEQFDKWVKAGGKFVQGLLNRRNAEKALFLTPSGGTK